MDEKLIAKVFIGEPVPGRIILLGRSFLSSAAPPFLANIPATASTVLEEVSITSIKENAEASIFHFKNN